MKAHKLGITRNRPFTRDQDDFLMAYYLEMTTFELAAELERSETMVHQRLGKLNLRRPRHSWTTAEDEALVSMLDDYSLEEIAQELGTYTADVKKRLTTQYVQKLVNVEVSEDEKAFVYEAHEIGFSVQEIAGLMGRSENETRLIMGKLKLKKPKTRTWSDEELSVIRGRIGYNTMTEIASMINRTTVEVRLRASAENVTRWTEEDSNVVAKSYASRGADEIAGELERTKQEVEDHITALREDGRLKI